MLIERLYVCVCVCVPKQMDNSLSFCRKKLRSSANPSISMGTFRKVLAIATLDVCRSSSRHIMRQFNSFDHVGPGTSTPDI